MPQSKPVRGYAPVNWQRIYYEIHGAGEPLLLIHGEFGTGADFAPAMPRLCRERQVIVVDLQGHGRTADVDRPLCFELLADDIAAVIRHLGFERADLAGFSLGGCIALQTAIRNPRAVRRLVVVSAPFCDHGWRPEARAATNRIDGSLLMGSAVHAAYEAVAPNPGDWMALAAKTKTLLTFPFDWTANLSHIEAPLMTITGESDLVAPEHADGLAELVANGRGSATGGRAGHRVTLPGAAHETILSMSAFADAVLRFLEEPDNTSQ